MLSVILPTYNEAANVRKLVPLLSDTLKKIPHEIIVVDDNSPDRTWETAEGMMKDYPELRVLRRVGKRGLSPAVVEGFNLANGDVLLVMDSDGQHDTAIVPKLYEAIRNGADLAVATRYREGGTTGEWRGIRPFLSRTATFLARKLPSVEVSDPMSGFFAVSKPVYRKIASAIRPSGFKILLELLAHLPSGTRVSEIPFTFGLRWEGRSKLTMKVQLQFISQLFYIVLLRLRRSFQWPLFFMLCLAAAIVLTPKAWRLLPLYTDADLRADVLSVLRQVADERGWLMSDIEMYTLLEGGVIMFTHRPHLRGADPATCYRLTLSSGELTRCDGR